MKTSEQIDAIAAAFVKAQAEIATVKKDKKADAGRFGYTYASLAAVVESIAAALGKHGLCYIQTIAQDDDSCTITTRLLHCEGQWFEGNCRMPVNGGGAQAVGSAITYGRRYGLTALLGIVTDDDDDDGAEANRHAPPAPPSRAKAGEPPTAPRIPPGSGACSSAHFATFRAAIDAVTTEEQLNNLTPMAENLTDQHKAEARILWRRAVDRINRQGTEPQNPDNTKTNSGESPPRYPPAFGFDDQG